MYNSFKGIVKVTQEQLEDLEKYGSIVIEGVTHIYEPYNILYITDELDENTVKSVAGKVGDVVLNIADINGLSDSINTLYNTIEDTTIIINDKIEKKIDKNPDGANPLVNNNNKINLTYIPDSILGQLVFGGLARPVYAAGVTDEYINFKFSDDAITKLELPQSDQTLRLQDIDLNKWEGLYFVVAKYYPSDDTSTWEVKTNDYGDIISLTVGDWLLSTGTSWEKVDNTDAVQSVAGKTGAVTLVVSDINGLREELDVKVPFTKYPDSTSVVRTFSDDENNVALSLEDNDTSKPKYFFKAFNNQETNQLESFYIQYYQGAETGVYETVLGAAKNPAYNGEMQMSFKPVREEATCTLNSEYIDNGTILYYRNNDLCAVTAYIHVKNITIDYTDNDAYPHGIHIATLPEGVNTFGAFYGIVQSQADSTPHPGQTYLVKIIGNNVYIATKGYTIDSSWLIGSVFFFKLPNPI